MKLNEMKKGNGDETLRHDFSNKGSGTSKGLELLGNPPKSSEKKKKYIQKIYES